MRFNPDIHHRRSVRLRNYDYSQRGVYYITICVQNRICIFGDVVDGNMRVNEIGEIVRNEWLKTAELRPNITLHEFVVMPNHFHGILEITENMDNAKCENVVSHDVVPLHDAVGALRATPLHAPAQTFPQITRPFARATDYEKNEYMSGISPKSNSFATIIRSFKSAVTRNIRLAGYDFAWQRNMWEHIICDFDDYARIADYINANPANWQSDDFYC